jgi:thiol-disulfide isomerase/thioredoxin
MNAQSTLLQFRTLAVAALAIVTSVPPQDCTGQEAAPQERLIQIELFVSRNDSKSDSAKRVLTELEKRRPGLKVVVKELERDARARERFNLLSRKLKNPRTPFVYGCNHWIMGYESEQNFLAHLRHMLLVQVFESDDCEPCDRVPPFMESFMRKYPGFEVEYVNTGGDQGRGQFSKLLSDRRISESDVKLPLFYLCNKLSMGFDDETVKTEELDEIIESSTIASQPASSN